MSEPARDEKEWTMWLWPDGRLSEVGDGLHGEWEPVVPQSRLVAVEAERDEQERRIERLEYPMQLLGRAEAAERRAQELESALREIMALDVRVVKAQTIARAALSEPSSP